MSGFPLQRTVLPLLILMSCAVCPVCSGDPVSQEQVNQSGEKAPIAGKVSGSGSESGIEPADSASSGKKILMKVVEKTPAPGKKDAVVNDPIAVVFNEAIDAKTADDAISVVSDNGDRIKGHVICRDDTVIFKTDRDLEYGTHYKVRVSRNIAGKRGGRISKDIVWDFSTNQAIMARLRVKNGDSIILSDITGYDFFEQEINSPTNPVPFTLRNEGTANLVIKSIEFSSGDANQFVLAKPALPITLEPEKEVKISVVFTPSTGGKKTAVLKIKSNDGVMGFFHLLMTGKGI